MTAFAVAIRLKIPDNEAYTAWTALRRLGVPVGRVERSIVYVTESCAAGEAFLASIAGNETLFNSNKHTIELLDRAVPRVGEMWIEELDEHDRSRPLRTYVCWRLYGMPEGPAPPEVLREAAAKLLCNPAIERAHYG